MAMVALLLDRATVALPMIERLRRFPGIEDLGGAHAATDLRSARDAGSSEARALEGRPLASHLRRRPWPSLGASGIGSTALCLFDFVYIFITTSIDFYDTLSAHSSPSIFCMFMTFLFTFYVNVCCFYIVYVDA
jgi:hypothetical protein